MEDVSLDARVSVAKGGLHRRGSLLPTVRNAKEPYGNNMTRESLLGLPPECLPCEKSHIISVRSLRMCLVASGMMKGERQKS